MKMQTIRVTVDATAVLARVARAARHAPDGSNPKDLLTEIEGCIGALVTEVTKLRRDLDKARKRAKEAQDALESVLLYTGEVAEFALSAGWVGDAAFVRHEVDAVMRLFVPSMVMKRLETDLLAKLEEKP